MSKEDKRSMGEINLNSICRRETKRRGEVQRRLAEESEKQSSCPKTIALASSNLPSITLDLIQQKISMSVISSIQQVVQLGFKVTKMSKSSSNFLPVPAAIKENLCTYLI